MKAVRHLLALVALALAATTASAQFVKGNEAVKVMPDGSKRVETAPLPPTGPIRSTKPCNADAGCNAGPWHMVETNDGLVECTAAASGDIGTAFAPLLTDEGALTATDGAGTAAFLAGAFLAAGAAATAFLGTSFFAGACFTPGCLTTAFLAGAFFAATFLAAVFAGAPAFVDDAAFTDAVGVGEPCPT